MTILTVILLASLMIAGAGATVARRRRARPDQTDPSSTLVPGAPRHRA